MDSLREGDVFPLQGASALLFNVTGLSENYPDQIPIQSYSQEVFQVHSGFGRRKQYSKEEWEAQKPIIEQLYIVEEKTFKRVINILRTKHNFFPTKSQFYRKICHWGLKKNIKGKEMQTIVQDLIQRANIGEDLIAELRGRKVKPVKIQRWRKRRGRVKDVLRLLGNPSTNYSPYNSSAEVTDPSQLTADSMSLGDHWNSVDVPGSPSLSGLFNALKIECESMMPSLDLTSPDPTSDLLPTQDEKPYIEMNGDIDAEECVGCPKGPSSKDLARYSQEIFQRSDTFPNNSNLDLVELSYSEWIFRNWVISRSPPLKLNISHIIGLSPFPILPDISLHRTLHHESSSLSARLQYSQDKEANVKCRVETLKCSLGGEDLTTIAEMKRLGDIYKNQYNFEKAERLYRRIATSYKNELGFKNATTLCAHLDLVEILRRKGELLEALEIHDSAHNTISQLVAQDNSLMLQSNSIRTSLMYRYGKLDEANKLIRQTLQTEVHTFGLWRKETLYDMNILCRVLIGLKKFDKSEQLLRMTYRLYEVLEGPFSRDSLHTLLLLTDVLEFQEHYNECRSLAMTIVERFDTLVGRERDVILHCRYKIAVCARRQGNLSESESLMQRILAQQIEIFGEKHPNTYRFRNELSITLGRMGRHSEAVTLLERNYERSARYYGMSYGETISSCRLLAATYASLGRYEDAVGLLQRVINETRKPEEKPTGDLLAIISDLGGHLQKAGRFAEAIPLQEECLRGFVEIYGLSERWTIDTIDQLGLCFERLGRYNDALGLYQESIDQIRNLEGGDHPAVMEISNFITRLHQMPAEFDEEDDESLVGSDSTETSVEMALTDEQNGDTDDRFATRDVHPGEEDWMGEFFDFDILENALLVRKAQVRTQENET